jgi:hypothetical protein
MQHGVNTEENYVIQIYVMLKNWHPPTAPTKVEDKFPFLKKQLKEKQKYFKQEENKKSIL